MQVLNLNPILVKALIFISYYRMLFPVVRNDSGFDHKVARNGFVGPTITK